ncbi:MAG TPA: tyrosine-type recombinase/integrase [Gemmata sp.]
MKRHPSGRAYCRWKAQGRTHERYFGRHGTPEAAGLYRQFAQDWSAGKYESPVDADAPANGGLFVAGLAARWLEHVRGYYTKDGRETGEVAGCVSAVRLVVDLYGESRAAEFDPAALRACRDRLVTRGLTRGTVNSYMSRIVRMFGWAGGQSLIPPTVHAALKLVERLKAGRTAAPDRERKKPATDAQIAATLPFLAPANPVRRSKLSAMVQIQRLAGMRPGEVCAMATADLDTTGDVWRYEVGKANKNRHRGKRQAYFLGPKAVAILRPYLEAAPDRGPIFGEKANNYGQAVFRASVKSGAGPWMPHQLRHALATAVAERFRTLEHAAAAIGDTAAVASAVYVHVDPQERAKIEVARAMG